MTRLALKSLAARPLRTALTTLAIVLGVALVTGALTLTDTQRRAADALSSASYDGTDAVVSAKTAFATDSSEDWSLQRPTVDPSMVERVRAVDGVEVAVGDITDQDAKIIGDDGRPVGQGPYFGIGFDADAPGAERVTPVRIVDGRWADGDGEVVVDQKTAEDQGYALGDRVRISGRGEAQSFEVVGVASFGGVKSLGPATVAVFDLETAQAVFDRDGYDSILVAGDGGTSGADVRRALDDALGASATVRAAAEDDRFGFDGLEQFISIIRIVLLVFGGVAVLVGALTIINSLSITVAQRTRELGLLRLVGASRRQVMGAVVGEALAIGLLGSLAGLGIGYLIAIGLQSLFASMGLDLPEAGTVFDGGTIAVALLVGTIVTLLAGLVPAVRATRVAPVMAVGEPGAAGAARAGLAGRLVRPVISLLARPGARLGGAAGVLARRNAMRQPGRTMATAGALAVGVALVTVLAVLAAGLRDTTTGSLERRVAATHVVIGQDGWSPIDPKAAETLAATPGVEAVTTVREDVGHAFGDNERVNTISGGQIGFDVAEGTGDAAALGADGAIVDEGWATEHGLKVGDRFELLSAGGDRLDLRIEGIETSSVLDALDLGPITIGPAAYEAAFRNERSVVTAVDAPGMSPAALERALAAFPDADVLTRQAFVDRRMEDVDTLMAIFVVLLALAVIVSLFGIVNALVLATFERRRELGTVRAVGMTRRQMRRMVRHESIVTALLGAATGIAAGLALGALVVALFGDVGLTYAVPTGTLVVLAVVAVVAGVLAAVVPARRAARLNPLTALAYE